MYGPLSRKQVSHRSNTTTPQYLPGPRIPACVTRTPPQANSQSVTKCQSRTVCLPERKLDMVLSPRQFNPLVGIVFGMSHGPHLINAYRPCGFQVSDNPALTGYTNRAVEQVHLACHWSNPTEESRQA